MAVCPFWCAALRRGAAVACGYIGPLVEVEGRTLMFADMDAWGEAGERGYTKTEAGPLILEMRAILAEGNFAPCYCGQRGEKRGAPCRTVLYVGQLAFYPLCLSAQQVSNHYHAAGY